MAYLITISCYGTHLRGDERGSVDPRQSTPGTPCLRPDAWRIEVNRRRMTAPAYSLDAPARAAVIDAFLETCSYRNWTLLAAHIRTEHLHVVIEAEAPPESVVRDLKAYASRRLNRTIDRVENRWTRRASIRRLVTPESKEAAIRYVADGQGNPMAVYVAPEFKG